MGDKVYVYSHIFTLPNLKETTKVAMTSDPTELIRWVKEDTEKYYVSNQKVLVYTECEEISINKILNPF